MACKPSETSLGKNCEQLSVGDSILVREGVCVHFSQCWNPIWLTPVQALCKRTSLMFTGRQEIPAYVPKPVTE